MTSHTQKKEPLLNRTFWVIWAMLLIGLIVADFLQHPHGAFAIDNNHVFYAWFGFASCAVLIIVSKLLGIVLKRKDDYYDA